MKRINTLNQKKGIHSHTLRQHQQSKGEEARGKAESTSDDSKTSNNSNGNYINN